MSPIKTLARESDFLASIFSKTLFSPLKTLGVDIQFYNLHLTKRADL